MSPDLGNHFCIIKAMLDYEITAAEAAQLLETSRSTSQASFVLLDVREPAEYQLAHIEGSRLIPMGEIPSRIFQEIDPETHIVTVCHMGVRSMNVAVWLRNQGYEHVQSMRGGIDAWSRSVDPDVPRY
jgi:rhodanese-related sulfurtransferase